jgi:enterochelin esterase-like enzyme
MVPRQGQPQTASFEETLVKDVIPYVEKHYRVLATPQNRAIAGLSMGGGHTVRTTLPNPGLFAYIGVFSAGTRDVTQEVEKQFVMLKTKNTKLYYVGCGSEDKLAFANTKTLVDVLKKVGLNVSFR